MKPVIGCIILVFWFTQSVYATVLPDERADLMYHSYDGGGATISGPSVLVRKNASTNTSVYYNYYIDRISSASLDVLVGGSPYKEKRTEQTAGVDYLHGKTITSLSYTTSVENDYKAGTLNVNMSQDFFGDMSTLTLGYTQGSDKVSRRGLSYDLSDITKQNYRIGLSQILTKDLIVAIDWETITDEATTLHDSGVTLNNPYRSYSYCSNVGCTTRGFAPEKYPNTHTSNALAISGDYYLSFRAALHGKVTLYQDSWGINAVTYQLGYTYPLRDWLFDVRARWYSQSKADFYSDLFDYQDQYTFMARDRELSAFNSTGIGFAATWNFAKNGWGWIDRGSLNFVWDHLEFNYHDFRNTLGGGTAGTEPLYSFGADVYQIFVSVWY